MQNVKYHLQTGWKCNITWWTASHGYHLTRKEASRKEEAGWERTWLLPKGWSAKPGSKVKSQEGRRRRCGHDLPKNSDTKKASMPNILDKLKPDVCAWQETGLTGRNQIKLKGYHCSLRNRKTLNVGIGSDHL